MGGESFSRWSVSEIPMGVRSYVGGNITLSPLDAGLKTTYREYLIKVVIMLPPLSSSGPSRNSHLMKKVLWKMFDVVTMCWYSSRRSNDKTHTHPEATSCPDYTEPSRSAI